MARSILRPVKALQPSTSHLLLCIDSPGFPFMLFQRSRSSLWSYFSIVELCLQNRFPLVSARKKHSNVIHFLICWRNSFMFTVYHVFFHEANDTQSVFSPQRHRMIEWQIAAKARVLKERKIRKKFVRRLSSRWRNGLASKSQLSTKQKANASPKPDSFLFVGDPNRVRRAVRAHCKRETKSIKSSPSKACDAIVDTSWWR